MSWIKSWYDKRTLKHEFEKTKKDLKTTKDLEDLKCRYNENYDDLQFGTINSLKQSTGMEKYDADKEIKLIYDLQPDGV